MCSTQLDKITRDEIIGIFNEVEEEVKIVEKAQEEERVQQKMKNILRRLLLLVFIPAVPFRMVMTGFVKSRVNTGAQDER